ncbi:MAG: acyl carrier protein [Thermoguttaceae bacterium]|nr:acyl carrier protein [Thermoguttaceae bacterium]MBR5415023.1 acyl carrier protein [Thermoguttaceae bacterium]MCR5359094.1 acyl carrier protein [Thermoguttaceae bacterium]
MSSEEIKEKVIGIIADQLGVDAKTITRDTDIANDLGADSLDFAELMIVFEEKFDIDIVEEDAQNITTVGQVIDNIEKQLKTK